jgi:hypothetical protein
LGYIGQHSYIDIWRLEDLLQRNKEYHIEETLSGFFLFAINNKTNEGYTIKKKTSEIYEIKDLSKISLADCIFCAKDINEFLLYLFDK